MKKNNSFQDEEYQFPQEEFADMLRAEEQSAENLVEPEAAPLIADVAPAAPAGLAAIWANHKRIITVVGVVLVVVVAFSWVRATHQHTETVAELPPAPVAPVVQPVIDPQVVNQLASLKQDAANNGAIIRQLQGQVQQLTDTLNQTRSAQQQLNQSLMVLVSQVQQLTTEVKVLANPPKPVKVKTAPKAVEPPLTFQLRAVVPGRAWIVGSDGQSQSVAVGDSIPQYGVVQSVDANAGVVITTSGKTIKF